MAEERQVTNEKNPVGAAILSALCPGIGFFYIGNIARGIAYILIFASLIVLQVESRRAPEHVVFGLLIAGFYIFQIFDSFNEAKKTQYRVLAEETNGEEKVSLFAAVVILVIGVFFQLAELGVLRYRDISKLWPLVLIALGAKFIFTYVAEQKEEAGGKNE